ncbi:MAG TPA: sterol desaturase family protein [Myxococcales bacterium]|nr:sterol desaturase family protein [Myxococcales bacterium]
MSVAEARAAARAEIGPFYWGVGHFLFVNGFAFGVIGLAATFLHQPRWSLLTVPITFLYANVVEYFAHKGPMHHRTRRLSLVFERHTLMHHQVFTRDEMRADSTRDFKMVLFPPVLLIFFFGFFALPVSLVLELIFGWNVAALFAMTAMAYYLLYEWLHLSYHLGMGGSLARAHSAHHGDATANFNITFPICDRLFGTCR